MNKEMGTNELKEHVVEFLNEHREGALATSLNNVPRSSPVQYFLGKGTDIFILSAGGDKFNAIAQNPNVCLLVNTDFIDYDKIKGVQIFGKATTSTQDTGIVDEAQKYIPDPDRLEKERDKLKVIKIVPTDIVYLDSLKSGDRTKQLLHDNKVILKEDKAPNIIQ